MADHHPKAEKELVQEQEALLDDPDFLKEIVRQVLQRLLEIEMTEHIGAAPYQRTEDRKGQRNGYKPRTLKTRLGKLELLVPQDLKRAPSPPTFSPATKETRKRSFWL
jgi:putative transposase